LAGFEEERNSTSKGKDSMSGKHSYMQQRHNVKEIMHKSVRTEQGLHKSMDSEDRTPLFKWFCNKKSSEKIGTKTLLSLGCELQ
jgi:hypothetical protein